jgi:transcriptional regulator with XRE-family HTH domain
MTPAELHAADPGLTRAQIADRLGLSLSQVQRALRGAPRVHGGGRKPGRAQTVAVTVRFTAEEIALVDAERGRRTRAGWVRALVVEAATPTLTPEAAASRCGLTWDGVRYWRDADQEIVIWKGEFVGWSWDAGEGLHGLEMSPSAAVLAYARARAALERAREDAAIDTHEAAQDARRGEGDDGPRF